MWHRLVKLTSAVGTAMAAGHPTEATLNVVDLILLILPWIGSLLLLSMIIRRPVEAMLMCRSSVRFRLRRS